MIKMSLAVKKLHDNHVVHSKLEPQNISMMNEFQPVIVELGFAKL